LSTLASLCELIIDCEHKTAPTVSEGYPLIRTPDIGVGRLDTESAQRVDEATYKEWTRRAVPQAGDLILAREAPVGNVGIVRPGIQPVLGQRTVLIRTRHDELDPLYLNYLLSGPVLRGWMAGVSSGATLPHLNMSDIRSMEIPSIPAVNVQRKIAAVLSAYDELVENNTRRIRVLEEMAQRIYREWFVDFRFPGHENVPLIQSELGPIPEGWAVRTLGEVCSLMQAGGTPLRAVPDYWVEGTVDWFTTTELQDGFLLHSAERVTEMAVQDKKTRLFPRGAILMAIYGSPTVGRLGVLTESGACNQAALAMIGHLVPQVVLYYALLELRAHFNSIAQGAAQQNISKQKVGGTPIVCPSPRLCSAAEEVLTPLWEQRKVLGIATERLRTTRDLLLQRLISGEVDVTDLAIAIPETAA
jgi:type I restriction enzyme S subunit